MMKNPPIYPTSMTPEEVIGTRNIEIFKAHYAICQTGTNGGEFPNRRIDNEVGAEHRPAIADCLAHLRRHGFVPNGIKPDGDIRWSVITKGEAQQLAEKGSPTLESGRQQPEHPDKEFAAMCMKNIKLMLAKKITMQEAIKRNTVKYKSDGTTVDLEYHRRLNHDHHINVSDEKIINNLSSGMSFDG